MIDWRVPCIHGRYEVHALINGKPVSWRMAVAEQNREVTECPGGRSVTVADLEGLGEVVFYCVEHGTLAERQMLAGGFFPHCWNGTARDCEMVERLLIPIPQDTEKAET